jgi:hypothetical protein
MQNTPRETKRITSAKSFAKITDIAALISMIFGKDH